jgi:hypothetical protein
VIYRGVELSEEALESYRNSVGKLIAWPMFSSFTETREEAEEYGRAWRGGIPVLFELRSAWCRRLRNGSYLQDPFAALQAEAASASTVKLVEVEVLEPTRVTELPGQRRGVIPKEGKATELHRAAECGDVRVIALYAARPEFINARDANGRTPLHAASYYGKIEAAKELVCLGANVNARDVEGSTPLLLASQEGNESMVRILVSFGADLNTPNKYGATPVFIASQKGHDSTVRTLASSRRM